MIGRVSTTLSRTTAKCPERALAWSTLTEPIAPAAAALLAPRWAIVRENLRRYAAGEKMLSEVVLETGY